MNARAVINGQVIGFKVSAALTFEPVRLDGLVPAQRLKLR
jgi:hypothetical protein